MAAKEITPAWLSDVLGADVAAVEVEDLGTGLGLLGEVARLLITYAEPGTGPERLIAKLQSPAAENQLRGHGHGLLRQGGQLLPVVVGDGRLRVPRRLHADIADDGAPFVLLLEEITDARTIDQIVGASYDDATRAIDLAVRLHAAFWSNDALAALEWLPPMNTPLNHLAGDLAVQKAPAFVAYWDGQLPAGSLEFVEALDTLPHYRDLLDWWVDQGHATYAHTDFRADNLLFGGSAGDDAVHPPRLAAQHQGRRRVGRRQLPRRLGHDR